MVRKYEVARDYRLHPVELDSDPTYTLREAAPMLGLRSSEGVRRLINQGRLPALRGGGYNTPLRIPVWAVLGLRAHRGLGTTPELNQQAAPHATAAQARQAALEDTLALLLEAREHEARALQLQQEVATELAAANRALTLAVTNVVVTEAPPAFDQG